MLNLKLATDPRWINIVEKSIEDILVDHAYCEQKATSTCMSMIINYPEKFEMVEALMPIVAEEWTHFRMVLAQLKKRGYKLGHRRKDDYVVELFKLIKKGGSREEQLRERLLASALIEARSCERFRILSTELKDKDLRDFYHELMISEAGHYRLFLDLAKLYSSEEVVNTRFEELLTAEAEILENIVVRGDRIH